MKYTTKSATQQLNLMFALPATGQEQDWELELSDGSRVEEFIHSIETQSFTEEIKFALCSLIVASFEEYILIKRSEKEVDKLYEYLGENIEMSNFSKFYNKNELYLWEKIRNIIDNDKKLLTEIIKKWSVVDYDSEPYVITPFFRRDF